MGKLLHSTWPEQQLEQIKDREEIIRENQMSLRLYSLLELSRVINRADSLEEILKSSMEPIRHFLLGKKLWIILKSESEYELYKIDLKGRLYCIKLSQSRVGKLLHSGALQSFRSQYWLLRLPLRHCSEKLGVLTVMGDEKKPHFSRMDMTIIRTWCEHLGNAIAGAASRRLNHHDYLTGLYARIVFDETYQNLFQKHLITGASLSMIIMDLDHFKLINDRFGHSVGDEMLQKTAEVISTAVRSSDTAARIGGEEFAILLPGCTESKASEIAETIRLKLNQLDLPSGLNLSASFGIGNACNFLHADKFFNAVDQTLYKAKNKGRNKCIRLSDPA